MCVSEIRFTLYRKFMESPRFHGQKWRKGEYQKTQRTFKNGFSD